MSLSVQLHRLPIEGHDLWVWHVLSDVTNLPEHDLVTSGWQLVEPANLAVPMLALTTQLAGTLPVLTMGQTIVKTWVKEEDIQATKAHPVILAFHYEEQAQATLFPYPPHQIGEVGLVWEGGQLQVYDLQELGQQGEYAVEQLKTLIDQVLNHPDISPLDEEWYPVQQAARNVAKLYWNYHLHHSPKTNTAVLAVQKNQKGKRSRTSRTSLAPLVARDPDTIGISPDPLTYAILHGLLSDSLYTLDEDRLIAEYQRAIPQGKVRITIRPGEQETWEEFLDSLKNFLGDEVVDTFCSVISLAFDHSPEDLTLPFFLNVDDILHVRRLKQSNRAFTPIQRAQVVAHLLALSRVEVNAEFPRGRGRRATTGYVKGVILELLKTVFGEYETLTGEVLWERREVKIGPWAKLAPFGPQTVLLFRKILEYHAQRQKYAKRFGRELTLQFSMHATNSTRIELTIEDLLALSEIALTPTNQQPENPSRTKTMIDEAFKLLQTDGIISAYGRLPLAAPSDETENERCLRLEREQDSQQRIDQRAQGWWKLYLKQNWYFEAPQPITALLPSPGEQKSISE